MSNSSIEKLSGRFTSLSIHNSKLGVLNSSAITMFSDFNNVSIGVLHNFASSSQGPALSSIRNTFVDYMQNFISFSDMRFDIFHINLIQSNSMFFHSNLILSNGIVNEVSPNGIISFTGDSLYLDNVFINELRKESIVLGGGTNLYLSNVKINTCSEPCFTLSSELSIRLLANVSINGVVADTVHDFRAYCRFLNNETKSIDTEVIGEDLHISGEKSNPQQKTSLTTTQNVFKDLTVHDTLTIENNFNIQQVSFVIKR